MRLSVLEWPKKTTYWIDDRVLYASVPFTWELPIVESYLKQSSSLWESAVVGGPAVSLMPNFFDSLQQVSIGVDYPGVLQKINPMATKTTVGCVRSCEFCAVPYIEGRFKELDDWPDNPVLIDNNLFASSIEHFDKVIERLVSHGWADFNQGVDSRLLHKHHAIQIKRIHNPTVRLALDSLSYTDQWECSLQVLRDVGLPKKCIRSYALIAFDSDPGESWDRCGWIENHGIKVLPMWFHELDAMKPNVVTDKQKDMGWNDFERRRIMQWFYQHKKAVR